MHQLVGQPHMFILTHQVTSHFSYNGQKKCDGTKINSTGRKKAVYKMVDPFSASGWLYLGHMKIYSVSNVEFDEPCIHLPTIA